MYMYKYVEPRRMFNKKHSCITFLRSSHSEGTTLKEVLAFTMFPELRKSCAECKTEVAEAVVK